MRNIGGGYLGSSVSGYQKVFLQVHSRNVLLSFSGMAGGIHYQLFGEIRVYRLNSRTGKTVGFITGRVESVYTVRYSDLSGDMITRLKRFPGTGDRSIDINRLISTFQVGIYDCIRLLPAECRKRHA
jgi:hypothetical protein